MTSRALRVARGRVLVPVVLLGFASACGFLADPGEYTSGADNSEGGTDTSAAFDSTPTDSTMVLSDGYVVPQSAGTIALMAGGRDPTSADDNPAWAADAWSGILDQNGHVVSWKIEQSAPVIGTFDSAGIVGGKWMMINNGFGIGGNRGTAIQSTTWNPGIAGDWIASNATGAPGGLFDFSRTFLGAHVVYVGGLRSVPVDGGGTNTFAVNEVHISGVDSTMNQLGASTDAGQELLTARSRPGVVVGKLAIYAVGGRVNGGGYTSSVEAAPVNADTGAFQPWVAQTKLMAGGNDYPVALPGLAISRGFLFVAGGRVGGNDTPTDGVLSASVDGTTGALGDFQTLNKLPEPLYNHALVAFKGRLYVIGGVGATSRSAKVYSAGINGDGTIGDWGVDQDLPAARSDFAAMAY